jgi:aspartate kinase
MVLKFGGSSLADPERIRAAARRIAQTRAEGYQVVAVVSARGDTTDELLQEASKVVPGVVGREMDAYLAAGEQMSAALMAMTLQTMDVPAISLTGWQAGIGTDSAYGNARILGLRHERIVCELEKGRVVVVAGFQGVTPNCDITTLGRGGSDTTAVALAALLQAEECVIYTDVDGVYDRDPRQYPGAVRFERIDYDRMLSLARSGAQVLHDRCVEWGKEHGVRIRVKSSFRPGPGTLVESFSPDPA